MVLAVVLGALFWQAAPSDASQAAALLAAGRIGEAQSLIANLDPRSAATQHLAGVAAYRTRQYPAAIEALQKAIAAEAPDSDAYRESALLTGQSYYLQARMPEAAQWLEKARAAGVRTPEALYMLGTIYIQLRRPPQAVAAFAELFQVPPDSAAAHLVAAQMMIRQEFEEQAQAELDQALKIDPKLPGARLLRGELATYRSRIEDAIADLKQEVAMNPTSAMAYYKLADAYSRRDDWDSAIPLLQKSIWLNPVYSGPLILLGKGYLQRKDFGNAEGILRRALLMDPQNFSAHYLLGQTLVKLGRADEGRVELQKSQQLRDPK